MGTQVPIYKALDVREYRVVGDLTMHNGYGGSSSRIDGKATDYFAVICENTHTHKRERIEFYKGREWDFMGTTHYYGYTGDYMLIVPGDHFIIEKTSTYDNVRILPATT